jgi:hypothetical protein
LEVCPRDPREDGGVAAADTHDTFAMGHDAEAVLFVPGAGESVPHVGLSISLGAHDVDRPKLEHLAERLLGGNALELRLDTRTSAFHAGSRTVSSVSVVSFGRPDARFVAIRASYRRRARCTGEVCADTNLHLARDVSSRRVPEPVAAAIAAPVGARCVRSHVETTARVIRTAAIRSERPNQPDAAFPSAPGDD